MESKNSIIIATIRLEQTKDINVKIETKAIIVMICVAIQ